MQKLVTGWHNTDAIEWVECPKCGSVAGVRCKTPQGRVTPVPHVERAAAYDKTFPDREGLYRAEPGVNMRARIHEYNAKLSQEGDDEPDHE